MLIIILNMVFCGIGNFWWLKLYLLFFVKVIKLFGGREKGIFMIIKYLI